MDNVTHFAALKAAARVAFGITILAGCSAETSTDDGDPTSAAESDYKKKTTTACHHDAGTPEPKKSCDQVLASAFPDAGAFVWHPAGEDGGAPDVADDVKSCCTDALESSGAQTKYRWACCDVLGSWNSGNQKVAIACTPWGPPVPPRMRRRNLALEGVA